MTTPHLPVHVRVNDAATGQPTPCRVRFTDAEGRYYAPLGRLTKFTVDEGLDVGGNVLVGKAAYAYIDGTCEIQLPAGPLTVEIQKGPEYRPLRADLHLVPGKLALRFALERWTNLREAGWYSGDIRALFLSPHAALLEGAAEDLAVVNLLAVEKEGLNREEDEVGVISNILAFSGQKPALEWPGHLVVVNSQNWHPTLGTLGLLNCHRVVHPLRIGQGPDEPLRWSLSDWCAQCHRKGGLVVWADFQFQAQVDGVVEEGAWAPEALADFICGEVDVLEFESLSGFDGPGLNKWYRLLNCGLRATPVGGSAKVSNAVLLGCVRTYARLNEGEAFSYKSWIEAVRAGRTFITDGPLLTVTVNGKYPGDTLDLAAEQTVRIRAEARGIMPFERLEIVVNGQVVAARDAAGTPTSAMFDADIPIRASGWLCARCGTDQRPGTAPTATAHTAPIYLRIAGQPMQADAVAAAVIQRRLDNTLRWIAEEAPFETSQQRERYANLFRNARAVLHARLA